MTDEEKVTNLEKENAELKAELKAIDEAGEHARKQITESFRSKKPYWELEKENEQLKKEISVLLSCANCQENKGGYVCEKEYNDKCLSQKIEYIKELKEEIVELKAQIESMKKALTEISEYADEKPIHNIAQNELNKWKKAE